MEKKILLVDLLLKALVGSGVWWVMSSYTNPLWLIVLVTLWSVATTKIRYEISYE